jgi:galactokinase
VSGVTIHQPSIVDDFVASFGGPPDVVARSPGRVNLIGDHTDYNDGFVLPMAIDRSADIAARGRLDHTIVARSEAMGETVVFDLGRLEPGGPAWGEYLKGVVSAFGYRGPGLDLLVASSIPLGAGLSSSAALELGIARIISFFAGWVWDPLAAARLCQRAENEWVGNACGIMDQLVVAGATSGNALLIDCRSLETRPLPLPERAAVVVLDTRTRRRLVTSEYNERRQACARAAAAYGVDALRDVEVEGIANRPAGLSIADWNRARHVVFENARVLATVEPMGNSDLDSVGQLMIASHNSLRDLFEVSTDELDRIVSLALAEPGCFGARMTGAGFGGCAVALFDRAEVVAAVPRIAAAYRDETGIEPDIYPCRPAGGTSILTTPS